jgi:serine/threonine protein kinase
MALSPGSRLGPYEIRYSLGAGGMGEVYAARDTRLGRDVAVKVLPAEVVDDRERRSRFRREAQLLASLNHPNIAAIHGLEEADGKPFLVLELVDGQDLAERLSHGALPVDEALTIARQIVLALEAAHQQRIVHRDLKPANIKLTLDGKVKVLDFGLARAYGGESEASPPSASPTRTRDTALGAVLGTAGYMAPEQAGGKPVDERADIWAFGSCDGASRRSQRIGCTRWPMPVWSSPRRAMEGTTTRRSPIARWRSPRRGNSVSGNGTLVYIPGAGGGDAAPIHWLPREGTASPLRSEPAIWAHPRFSPAGDRLAMAINDLDQWDVWVYDWLAACLHG